jgi:hypothetical protein
MARASNCKHKQNRGERPEKGREALDSLALSLRNYASSMADGAFVVEENWILLLIMSSHCSRVEIIRLTTYNRCAGYAILRNTL